MTSLNKIRLRALVMAMGVLLSALSLSVTDAVAQVGSVSATVQDDTTNYYSRYDISFQISNGNSNTLSPTDNDSVVVVFDNAVTLPASISTTEISIEGTNPGSSADIVITGQRLAVKVPILVNGKGNSTDRTVNIVISRSADIRNPGTAGTYAVQVETTPEPTPVSANYDIFASTSTVSQASVTPNPSIEARSAAYTIGFSVGKGGFLTNSSTVDLAFPAGTTVPDGAIAGVTFNGTTTSAIGDATARTVTVDATENVDNNGSVTIQFGKGSGLKNPNSATGYTIDVNTSSETTPVASSGYNISDPADLSFSSIALVNDTVNAVSRYDIDFFVGNLAGALDASAGDKFIFTFFPTTKVPTSISTSNVTVLNQTTGFSNTAAAVRVDEFTTGGVIDSSQVVITTPIDIGNGDEVRVTFAKNAGIQNEASATSDSIRAKTTESDEAITINDYAISNPFSVFAPTSTITQPSVTLSNATESASSNYTINFSVGKYGRLVENVSTITVDFPTGTDLSTITGATVNGTSATTTSTSGQTYTITIPSGATVTNNGSVTVVVNGVTNPLQNTYALEVHTSAETGVVQSQSYEISNSQVTVSSTSVGTTTVNSVSTFSFGLTGTTKLTRNDSDFIELTFPEGTIVPTSIVNGDITLGNQTVQSVTVDSANRILKIFVNDNNKAPSSVDIAASAGITHPAVPGSGTYDVLIGTSLDAPGTSATYTLSGNTTAVTGVTATSNPNTITSSSPSYEISFTTGAAGKLTGGTPAGSSTITIRFNSGTTTTVVPSSINANDVTVEGVTSGGVSVSGDDVTVTVPNGVTIDNSQTATVFFESTAGLSNNAPAAGTYDVQVNTSSETTYGGSNNLTLQSAVSLSVNSVSRTETRVNTASAYTIKFTPGTGNGLAADTDTIYVDLPNNTFIPDPFSKTNVAVNGITANVEPIVTNNQSIAVITPTALAEETEATLSFSSIGSILNPSTVGSSFTLDLYTNLEPTPVTSSSYSTTATSTTVSAANVSLANASTSTSTSYTIDFNTGAAGRLIEGTSTITVRFPSGTSFGALTATINGTTVNIISTSSLDATFTLPSLPSDSVWNSDDISLVVNNVVNPGTEGSRTLQVRSSVETNFVTSNSYSISNVGPVTINNFTVTQDTVNEAGDYFFDFTVDGTSGALAAGSGTIVLTFPGSSAIPSTIANSDVTVSNLTTASSGNASDIVTSPTQNEVEITVPVAVNNGDNVTVSFLLTANVINPKEPDSYQWQVATSAQPTAQSTALTPIYASVSTGISNLRATVSPSTTGTPVTWTWGFRTGSQGALEPGVGQLFLEFGDNNAIFNNDPIPSSSVTINGIQLEDPVRRPPVDARFTSLDTTVVELIVPSTVTIGNNDSVTVIFSDAAGIEVDPTLAKVGSKSRNTIQANSDFEASSSAETIADIDSGNPLPIELTSFTVEANVDEYPELRWVTETERENFGFYIDRVYYRPGAEPKDGAEPAEEAWSEIAFREGSGTTIRPSAYSYIDETADSSGTYKYRLRQVDFDGTSTPYGPVTFRLESPIKSTLLPNYPNPFNPTTIIPYRVAETAKVTIKVYNVLGREVMTLVDGEKLPGNYQVRFNGASLASGLYFVRFNTAGVVSTRKMMLLK